MIVDDHRRNEASWTPGLWWPLYPSDFPSWDEEGEREAMCFVGMGWKDEQAVEDRAGEKAFSPFGWMAAGDKRGTKRGVGEEKRRMGRNIDVASFGGLACSVGSGVASQPSGHLARSLWMGRSRQVG